MRSELLYTTEQGYIAGTTDTVELYDRAFLQMVGRGEGSIDWAGKGGRIEWTNFPSRRPDDVRRRLEYEEEYRRLPLEKVVSQFDAFDRGGRV